MPVLVDIFNTAAGDAGGRKDKRKCVIFETYAVFRNGVEINARFNRADGPMIGAVIASIQKTSMNLYFEIGDRYFGCHRHQLANAVDAVDDCLW